MLGAWTETRNESNCTLLLFIFPSIFSILLLRLRGRNHLTRFRILLLLLPLLSLDFVLELLDGLLLHGLCSKKALCDAEIETLEHLKDGPREVGGTLTTTTTTCISTTKGDCKRLESTKCLLNSGALSPFIDGCRMGSITK
eukprot:TRINITY_DN13684_c0_g1_i1.p2 TRINITY_DN13684_c0_g1~~TRINITY_DN13684_c0_g1_i1.p2  ORF type:complete len:141 (+),score=7.10 TRINITY_DN13684_c0_g1_i1:481-903(+)